MKSIRRVFMLVVVTITFLACGSEEATQSPEAEETLPDVSTAIPEMNEAIANCLDLVHQQEYEQAIPVCTQALGANPDNTDVQTALTTAQEKADAKVSELGSEASKEMQKKVPGM